jgi:hypothetical protein
MPSARVILKQAFIANNTRRASSFAQSGMSESIEDFPPFSV